MNINVKVNGLNNVMNDFTNKGLKAQGVADNITETYTRKMANESSSNAPVKTGDLRADIAASPRSVRKGVWQFGSTLPYAGIQEYEHRTKKGFIRNSVWRNRNPYRDALRKEVGK